MRLFSTLLTCCAFYIAAAPAMAEPVPDALRTELKLLSADIAQIVEKNGGGSIAVGEIASSANVSGSAGPGIQLVLADELQQAGLTIVTENYKFEVSCRYQPFHDTPDNRAAEFQTPEEKDKARQAASNLQTVKLVALLIDSTGFPLAKRPTGRIIFGSETVSAMLGLGVSHPPLRDPRDLSKNIEEALKEPQVDVQGTKIAGKTAQYAIEILVKNGSNYVPQPVTFEKEKPFVPLQQSSIYGVRLINNSAHEAAVDLRIDGVNAFAFSQGKSTYWIVPPQAHVDILGWHRTNEVITEFKVVGNFPDTAAAKLNLKPSGNIGLISVSFSASWENDSKRPSDEPELKGRGTGFGNDVNSKSEQVERTIGQSRDTISVRYER